MELGLGVLRLAPEHFWSMTPGELIAAIDGYAISRGGKPRKKKSDWDGVKALIAEHSAPTKSIRKRKRS